MGRRATPTAVLKMRGSWRANAREKRGEVKATPGEIVPYLPLSPDALLIFQRLVSVLQPQGIIGTQDGFALAMLAESIAKYENAHVQMQATGGMVLPNGKSNPWYQVMQMNQKLAMQIMGEYGMTATSRQRLGVVAPAGVEPGRASIESLFKFKPKPA